MSTSKSIPSALSADGSIAAVVAQATSSRLHVQLYDVESQNSKCTLRYTLAHATESKIQKLTFCGTHFLIALVVGSKTSIVTWDITRGVVADTIELDGDDEILDVTALSTTESAATTAAHFFVLVGDNERQRLFVQEFLGKKCKRKIKSGKWRSAKKLAMALAASEESIAVYNGDNIRVLKQGSGEKVATLDVNSNQTPARLTFAASNSNMLLFVPNDSETASLYTVDQPAKEPSRIAIDSLRTQFDTTQIRGRHGESDMTLVVGQSLFSGNSSSCAKVTDLVSTHPFALYLLEKNQVLALIQTPSLGLRPKWITIDDDTPTRLDLQIDLEVEAGTISKRKMGKNMSVLGPGQAGSESLGVEPDEKRQKRESDQDDDGAEAESEAFTSIGDRLRQLNKTLDSEMSDRGRQLNAPSSAFVPRQATTESLKEFLSQALEANDDSLLEQAFIVRDVDVIESTLKDLSEEVIVQLIGKLTARLASNPLRADSLSSWLSMTLMTGQFTREQLGILKNMLSERIETLPDLLRLEGRLSVYK